MWSCFGGFLSSQNLQKSKKLKTATTIMHHSDEYKPPSSSVAKVLRHSKNKDVVRPSNTTSVQSITELLTFRYLVLPSKSNDHHHLAAPLHITSSSSESSFLSSSVNLISNNEDLLTQILLFLPAKSVIRFQCVSKEWLSLISSSRFRRLHSQQNPTSFSTAETGLFLFRRIFQNSELNSITFREEEWNSMGIITSRFINFLNVDGQILGLHCCNGLVWVDFHWNYEIRRYYVYNPATNQYRFIPRPKTTGKGEDVKAVNIVYDPLKSDQYKLVCILLKSTEEGEAEDEYMFSVYTLETGVWKDVDILTYETCHDYYFERGVVCNGNLYWTNSSRDVLCFDFEIERVRSVNMTVASEESSESQERILFYFGNSSGNLQLIDLGVPEGTCLNVLELELDIGCGEYHTGWLLKYHIDLDILTARYPLMLDLKFADFERRFAFGILSFFVEEKENKAKLMISLSGKIIFYEINGMNFEEIVDILPADLQFLGLNMSRYNWKDAYKHFETLASV